MPIERARRGHGANLEIIWGASGVTCALFVPNVGNVAENGPWEGLRQGYRVGYRMGLDMGIGTCFSTCF